MRKAAINKRMIAAVVAVTTMLLALGFVLPQKTFALQERHVWFTYGYTECTGDVHSASDSDIVPEESSGSAYLESYSTIMMFCDTDHAIHVEGDGVTADNVTFTSLTPAVLDIDSAGNVTLNKTGTARIEATVAADNIYVEKSIYLDIKVDKHDAWNDTVRAHYEDRPAAWGLDLDVSDGPHQLVLLVRPGAKVRFSSENPDVADVSSSGMVTPKSAGTTQIIFEIYDDAGKYKPCRIGETIKVSNNDPQPDPQADPVDREVLFTYDYVDCLGESVHMDKEQIGYYVYPTYFGQQMMMCDTNHVVHVVGDGVTADNVTFTSSDPSVLRIDNEGNVTLLKTGKAEITATVAADAMYNESTIYLGVTVDRHDGWIGDQPVHYEDRSPFMGLDLDTSDGSHQLVIPLRPGATVKYYSLDPNVAYVDQTGLVTPVSAGQTTLKFEVTDADGKYKEGFFLEHITVTGEDLRSEQEITGDLGPYDIDWHDGLQLDLQAKTEIVYRHVSGANVMVKPTGEIVFKAAGEACVRATAVATKDYKQAEVLIYITAHDYAAEEAAQAAAANNANNASNANNAFGATVQATTQAALAAAAAKAEALKAQALSLKKPVLKVKALKGKKNKITWDKVENADGYVVYVKYPGAKKYVKAVTRDATVKSVTHKGLSRSKTYKYKVAAYKVVDGHIYYSPFSKVRKAKVR